MAVHGGSGVARSAFAHAGAGSLAAARARLSRQLRDGLFRRVRGAGDKPSVPLRAAPAADVIGRDEREQVLAQARVHGMVAIQLSEVMRGNLGKREDLRHQLIQRPDTDDLSAAWLRLRIGELDRLVTQQVAAVDWHLRESRRLHQLIGAG